MSAAVVDIYITAWLCYHLHDSKTGHAEYVLQWAFPEFTISHAVNYRSDSMVTKLVNYAITRGIVTS